MITTDTICRALGDRIESIIQEHVPNAKKEGYGWKLGDINGGPGKSARIYRGSGGIFFCKDHATDNAVTILGLLHNVWGTTFVESCARAKEICNLVDVVRPIKKKKPKEPYVKRLSMRGTDVYEYWINRGIPEHIQVKYKLRRIERKDLPPSRELRWNESYTSFVWIDTCGDVVTYKWLGIEKNEDGKNEIGSTSQYATLWGWWLVDDNTREICIVEGEADTMSIALMHPDIPVLSLPSGVSNLGWIENDFERLQLFEKIYICTDMDGPGEKSAQTIAKRLGLQRCFRISLPTGYKDANQFLTSDEHGKPEFAELVNKAKTYGPKEMVAPVDMVDRVIARGEEIAESLSHRTFLFPKLNFKLCAKDTGILTGFIAHGKALALDTKIPTPIGMRAMGHLQVGDQVIGADGMATTITYTSPVFHNHDCYKITFDDGTEVVADKDHKWRVHSKAARNSRNRAKKRERKEARFDQQHKRVMPKVIDTEELFKTQKVHGVTNYSIDVAAQKCGLTEDNFPVKPYTLGAWLGDGSSYGCGISVHHTSLEIVDHIRSDGYEVTSRPHHELDYGIQGVWTTLRDELNLRKNKHIPECYFLGDYATRFSLLQGLMDTDGYVDTRGTCEYTSVRKPLADDVLRLACSLGIKANMCEGDATIGGRFISKKYRVTFTTNLPVFRLQHKAERVRQDVRSNVFLRMIKKVEKVDSVPTKCIAVDNEDHLYLCTDRFIPTHNTDIANCIMLNEIRRGEVVCIFACDTPVDDLIRLCAWQMVGHEPSPSEIELCIKALDGKIFFVDGVEHPQTSESVMSNMKYAAARFGVTRFLIDNLSEIADIRKDDYQKQGEFVRAIDKFDKKEGTNSMIVAHALMSGDSCDWRIPGRRDVEGDKGMVKPIQYGISIFRNKVKEKPHEFDEGENTPKKIKRLLEGSDAYLSVWKQRNAFREEFEAGLQYHKKARWYAPEFESFESPFPLYPSKQIETGDYGERVPQNDAFNTD